MFVSFYLQCIQDSRRHKLLAIKYVIICLMCAFLYLLDGYFVNESKDLICMFSLVLKNLCYHISVNISEKFPLTKCVCICIIKGNFRSSVYHVNALI